MLSCDGEREGIVEKYIQLLRCSVIGVRVGKLVPGEIRVFLSD